MSYFYKAELKNGGIENTASEHDTGGEVYWGSVQDA